MRLLIPRKLTKTISPEAVLQKAREVEELPLSAFQFQREYQEAMVAYVVDVVRDIYRAVAEKFGVRTSKIGTVRKSFPVAMLREFLTKPPQEAPELLKALFEDPSRKKDLAKYYKKVRVLGRPRPKPAKIGGKTFTHFSTGKPMTEVELRSVEKAVIKALGDNIKGLDEEMAVRASVLGLLQATPRELREAVKTLGWDKVVVPQKYKNGEMPRSIKSAKEHHKFGSVMQHAIEAAKRRAGEYLSIEDGMIKKTVVKTVRDVIVGSLEDGVSAQRMASRLFHMDPEDALGAKYSRTNLEVLARDWRRVAITETARAMNDGFLATVAEKAGKEPAYVVYSGPYYPPEGSAGCNQFLGNVYLLVATPSKAQRRDDRVGIKDDPYATGVVWPGKNNIGRKPKDWWACIPTHPHCRHFWQEIWPDVEKYDVETGAIVPATKKAEKGFARNGSNVLDKSKRVWVPPTLGRRGYYRFDPREKEEGEKKAAPKIGSRARIKPTASHLGRGVVGIVREIAGGAAKIMDDMGRAWRVPVMQLEYAKSHKHLVFRLRKAAPGLVKRPVMVRGKTRMYQAHRWVRLGEEEKGFTGRKRVYDKMTGEEMRYARDIDIQNLFSENPILFKELGELPDFSLVLLRLGDAVEERLREKSVPLHPFLKDRLNNDFDFAFECWRAAKESRKAIPSPKEFAKAFPEVVMAAIRAKEREGAQSALATRRVQGIFHAVSLAWNRLKRNPKSEEQRQKIEELSNNLYRMGLSMLVFGKSYMTSAIANLEKEKKPKEAIERGSGPSEGIRFFGRRVSKLLLKTINAACEEVKDVVPEMTDLAKRVGLGIKVTRIPSRKASGCYVPFGKYIELDPRFPTTLAHEFCHFFDHCLPNRIVQTKAWGKIARKIRESDCAVRWATSGYSVQKGIDDLAIKISSALVRQGKSPISSWRLRFDLKIKSEAYRKEIVRGYVRDGILSEKEGKALLEYVESQPVIDHRFVESAESYTSYLIRDEEALARLFEQYIAEKNIGKKLVGAHDRDYYANSASYYKPEEFKELVPLLREAFDEASGKEGFLKSIEKVLHLLLKAAPGLVRRPVMVRGKTRTYQAHRWMRLGEKPTKEESVAKMTVESFVEEVRRDSGMPVAANKMQSLLKVALRSPEHAAFFLNNIRSIMKDERIGTEVAQDIPDGDVYAIIDKALSGGYSLWGFRNQVRAFQNMDLVGVGEWDLSFREYATMRDPTSTPEDIWYAVMGAWGSSTKKEAAILLQEAARDELLGGKGFIWQMQQREEQESAQFRQYETPVENIRKLRQMVRKKYERTQRILRMRPLPKTVEAVFSRAAHRVRERAEGTEGLEEILMALGEMQEQFLSSNVELTEKMMELVREYAAEHKDNSFVQEALKYVEESWEEAGVKSMDKIVLFRGVKDKVVAHNVAESWTEIWSVADKFDGYEVLEESVPISRVLVFYDTDTKLKANDEKYEEKEYILLSEEPKLYKD